MIEATLENSLDQGAYGALEHEVSLQKPSN
jgi:hypothetical protein